MFPNANALVPVEELLALNEALRKSATIGYQTPAGTTGGATGNLSPLVAQSIEGTLTSTTFTQKALVFWPMLPKTQIGQTVHEYSRVIEHGQDVDPFIGEGGAGTDSESKYDRKFVRVKYLAERKTVTDVSTMVGLIGSNPAALAEATEKGTISLLKKLELALLFSKDTLSAKHWHGVIPQIIDGAPENVTDARGKTVTPNLLQFILGELCAPPRYGEPDVILVDTKAHTALVNYANQFGRHDQLQAANGVVTYGPPGLQITGPFGPVPIKAVPFLLRDFAPSATASSATAPATPTFAVDGGGTVASAVAGSKWVADDVGEYVYKFVAVSTDDDAGGYSAPLTSSAVTIAAAGDAPSFEVSHPNGADYLRIYRSTKGGAASTCKLIDEIPVNTDGAHSKTAWTDLNEWLPGTSCILLLQMSSDTIEFVRLLDFIRRPLPVPKTVNTFLLMLFGAPIVKVPTKGWLIKNAGVPAPTDLLT